MQEETTFEQLRIDSGNHDFYRCNSCRSLITRVDEIRAIRRANETGKLAICPCGSRNYSPSWPVTLEWFKPSVVLFVIKVVLVRVVAPRFPFLVGPVQRLVA